MSAAAQVYRAFDATGRLLYIGSSVEVDNRLKYHAQNSPWWPFMDRVERQDFPDRDAALEAETRAIAIEHPRWNMQGRSADHPDGSANDARQATWLVYERDVARRWRNLRDEEAVLLNKIRRVRMSRAGVNAEIAAINAGLVIDENVA